MKNSFGNLITVSLFGESHGEYIGAMLDGLPSGIFVDYEYIKNKLAFRRANDELSTARKEKDDFKIISGVNNGYTTGTPLSVLIKNNDVYSADYQNLTLKPRPSHSDFSAFLKYGEYGLLPGGGHFSGRITAPLVAVGAICQKILEEKGVKIATHIKSIGNITDRDFSDFDNDFNLLNTLEFFCFDGKKSEEMREEIINAKNQKDSIGGVLETAVIGLEAGMGEPWFDSFEGVLSHGLFSIPGVKGVEFGSGFEISEMRGSKANDQMNYDDGKVSFTSNNSGGILGGISNGNTVIFRTAFKPTPSIGMKQNTVDLQSGENTVIEINGRHDPCIVNRARPVVDAITAICLLDLSAQKYGRDGIK